MIGRIKKLIRNDYLIVYFFDIIAKCFSAIISILIIRALTVEDYAEYTMFFSVSSLLSGVLGNGMGLAYTTYAVEIRETQEDADGYLFKELSNKLFVLYPIVSLLCYFIIGNFVKGTKITILFGVIYGMLLAMNQINTVFFQARKRYFVAGLIANIRSVILSVLLFVVINISRENSIKEIYLLYIFTICIALIISYARIYKIIKRNSSTNVRGMLFDMLRDSFWTIMYMLVVSAFSQLDVFMIEYYRTAEEVAFYGVAYKYYALVISVLPAIQVVLRVNCSNKDMLDCKVRKGKILDWIKKSWIIGGILLACGTVGAHVCFPIVNGEGYNESIYTFDILLVGAVLSYLTAPCVSIMVATKKQKVLFVLAVIALMFNFIGNNIFIPRSGIMAAAVVTVLSFFILNGGSALYLLLERSEHE